jgi:hypothetical protein
MKIYKARLRDESAEIIYDYVLADSLEEAEVKARWQYPNYYTVEIVGVVTYKEDEESENEEHTY